MAISPEAYLISSILRDQDLNTAMARGVSKEMFHSYDEEWEWLENYYLRHKKVPTKAAFKATFPEFSIKAVNDTGYFSDQVRQSHARYELTGTIRDVSEHLADGDVDRAVKTMHSSIVTIASCFVGSHVDNDILEHWEDTYADVEARVQRVHEKGAAGILTGFRTLDERTGGPQPGDLAVVAGRLGSGKGHPLSEEVATPDGWKKWGDLQVGDYVFGRSGKPTRITAIYDRGSLPVYRVTFTDHTSAVVDGDHLWQVQYRGHSYKWSKTAVVDTRTLASTNLRVRAGWKYRIPMVTAVEYPHADLPIDPYVLGAFLANGSATSGTQVAITTPDADIINRIRKHYPVPAWDNTGWESDQGMICPRGTIVGLAPEIRRLGLTVHSRDKFIPTQYLQGSVEQRVALLQGLMDGDGSTRARQQNRSSVLYFTSSRRLARDITELVNSLGGTCIPSWTDRGDKGVEGALCILLPNDIIPFHTSSKTRGTSTLRAEPKRAITSVVRLDDEQEIRCISVDADDSLYTVTRNFIVTHNTWAMLRMATAAVMSGARVQFDSLEQSRAQIAMRLHTFLSNEVGKEIFRNMDLMQGRNFDLKQYKLFLSGLRGQIKGSLHVADQSRGKVSPLTIAAQIERNNPDIVFIDYITLMEKSGDGDWRSLAKLSGDLKSVAMEYGVPIVTASQLNRAMGLGKEPAGPEALAQSDALGQDADSIITMKQRSLSVVTMKMAKYRHGAGGFTWHCEFRPQAGIFREVNWDRAQELMDADAEANDKQTGSL